MSQITWRDGEKERVNILPKKMLHVTIEGSIVTSLLFTFEISVLYLKTWVVQKNKVISNSVCWTLSQNGLSLSCITYRNMQAMTAMFQRAMNTLKYLRLRSNSLILSPSEFWAVSASSNDEGDCFLLEDRIRELLRNLRYFRVFIALWNIAVIACMFLYVIQLSDRPFWLRVQHTVWNHLILLYHSCF